jgi:hypothetical protein
MGFERRLLHGTSYERSSQFFLLSWLHTRAYVWILARLPPKNSFLQFVYVLKRKIEDVLGEDQFEF